MVDLIFRKKMKILGNLTLFITILYWTYEFRFESEYQVSTIFNMTQKERVIFRPYASA